MIAQSPVLCWTCRERLSELSGHVFCADCDDIKYCEDCEDVIIPAYDDICDSCYKEASKYGCACGSCDGAHSYPHTL